MQRNRFCTRRVKGRRHHHCWYLGAMLLGWSNGPRTPGLSSQSRSGGASRLRPRRPRAFRFEEPARPQARGQSINLSVAASIHQSPVDMCKNAGRVCPADGPRTPQDNPAGRNRSRSRLPGMAQHRCSGWSFHYSRLLCVYWHISRHMTGSSSVSCPPGQLRLG